MNQLVTLGFQMIGVITTWFSRSPQRRANLRSYKKIRAIGISCCAATRCARSKTRRRQPRVRRTSIHLHRDQAEAPRSSSGTGPCRFPSTTATTGTVGDGQFPAKFTFDVSAPPSCLNDFVVYNTGLLQSTSHPGIVAFNELYSSQGSIGGFCNQNGPSVMWSYRTGTTGTTPSGPILSLDGTKVAYVENIAGSPAVLHILKWKALQGTLSAPVTPDVTLVAGAAWSTCPAGSSCVANLTFSGTGSPQDTISSPFYRYDGSDTLYVGDSTGHLQKFTGVFSGTPTVVSTGGWPILVHNAATLTSPVYDGVSQNIFVGDSGGQLSFVMETGSTTGACGSGSPPCLGSVVQALGGAIVDGPLVDSSAQTVFAFEGTDATNQGTAYQFNTQLATASEKSASIGCRVPVRRIATFTWEHSTTLTTPPEPVTSSCAARFPVLLTGRPFIASPSRVVS